MDNLRICKECKTNKELKDYIRSEDTCYRCVYAMKVAIRSALPKEKLCKVCKIEVPCGRNVYCSDECLLVAKNKRRHWTQTTGYDTKDWKRRFNFKSNWLACLNRKEPTY